MAVGHTIGIDRPMALGGADGNAARLPADRVGHVRRGNSAGGCSVDFVSRYESACLARTRRCSRSEPCDRFPADVGSRCGLSFTTYHHRDRHTRGGVAGSSLTDNLDSDYLERSPATEEFAVP